MYAFHSFPLLEKVPTDSAVADAVEKCLNVALKAVSLNCEIRTNRDTKKVYPISLDGTAVEKLLDDLDCFSRTCQAQPSGDGA